MKKLSNFSLLILAGAIGLSAPAYAQEVEEITTGSVVISATRTEQKIEDVPSTMEVLDSQQIEQMGAQSVQEIIQKAGNLITEGQNGGVSIRGMGSGSTIILINGRRPIVWGSPNETNRRIMDMVNAENIERIEILRGPASALYGDALAGVINIITKTSKQDETMLKMTAGSQNYTVSARHDTGAFGENSNWSNVTSVEYHREWSSREHDRETGERDDPRFSQETFANNSLRYSFENGNDAGLETTFVNLDSSPTNSTMEYALSNLATFNGSTGDHMYSFGFNHGWANRANRSIYEKNSAGNWQRSSRRQDEISNVFTLDGQDTWMLNDYNMLTFGGEVDMTHYSTGASTDLVYNISIFAQDEISLFDERLYIVPALRYDYYSSFGSNISPKIGATFEYLPNQRFKANYGLTYNAPTAVQLYGFSQGGYGVSLASDYLEPERGTSWEVRFEGDLFADKLFYAVGYFNNTLKDQIDTKETPEYAVGQDDNAAQAAGVVADSVISGADWAALLSRGPNAATPDKADYTAYYQLENRGETKTQGVEATVRYNVLDYLTLGLEYNYLEIKDGITNQLRESYAEHIFTPTIDFYYAPWDFYASLWGKYNMDYRYNQTEVAGDTIHTFDFFKMNLSVSKIWEEKYTVTFNAINFWQSERTERTDSFISPTEYKLSFSMKF